MVWSSLGRAVIVVSHASGFLRLCRRALHKLARLDLIPVSTKYLQRFYYYTINPLITQIQHKIANIKQTNHNSLRYEQLLNWILHKYGFPFLVSHFPNKIGPGLLSIRSRVIENNWMVIYLVSARLKPEGTVQSCCVILGFITQSKYFYMGLREAYLPTLQVLFLLDAIFYPCRARPQEAPF